MSTIDIPKTLGRGRPGAAGHLAKSRARYDKYPTRVNDGFGVIHTANGAQVLTKTQLDRVRQAYIQHLFNAAATARHFKGKVSANTIRTYAKKHNWKAYAKRMEEAKEAAVIQNAIQDEVVARTVTINFIDQRIEWLKKEHSEKIPKDVDAAVDKLARLRELLTGNADSRAGMTKQAVFEFLRQLTPEEREKLAKEWDSAEPKKVESV